MNYHKLIDHIQNTHASLYQASLKSVNFNLTLRNILTGYYIVEYEQKGDDRAKYGTKLLQKLAKSIQIKGLTSPELSRCRQFYKVYAPILGLVTKNQETLQSDKILGSLTQLFTNKSQNSILGAVTQELESKDKRLYYSRLLQNISYTHFVELIKIEDSLKRKFYELLILNTQLSVRELKRQIESLAFERVGFSENHETALQELRTKILPETHSDIVKTHYFFEFLNLKNSGLVEESELETALLSHLQEFIIELGNGFCFEARQKRILIEDEYFFIDLVFYHRILKCHVIIELKTKKAKHQHIGQLKSYIQFYKKNIMQESDNPPVGILLVTDQNKTLVEYAIADSDQKIFVSKYALELPKKEELEAFINKEIKSRNR